MRIYVEFLTDKMIYGTVYEIFNTLQMKNAHIRRELAF